MTNLLDAARDKMNSGFFDPGPKGIAAGPADQPTTGHDPLATLEDRVERIEVHLGLRPKPAPPPPPTHATCSVSGLTLDARFFPQGTDHAHKTSNLISVYKNAHPDAKAKMAQPWTIRQDSFDKFCGEFFPDGGQVTVAKIQDFLTTMASKRLGIVERQVFANRSHMTGTMGF